MSQADPKPGNDASTAGGTTTTKVANGKNKKQDKLESYSNPMMEFSTSTYTASIYLQSPAQFNKMVQKGQKNVRGMSLIMQSGGIGNSPGDNFGAIRDKNFPEDFYLDNIQFRSHISGTSVGAPHNSFDINFTVTEPMGLTLLERLDKAVADFNNGDKTFNHITQMYVMVIRFYGYDENGKPLSLAQLEKSSKTDKPSDPAAVSEKWIPFNIRHIRFSLSAEQVVYNIEAVPSVMYNAHDKIHGTIPFNLGIQGQTIKDLLTGTKSTEVTANLSQNSDSDATPPPSSIVIGGLHHALNKAQADLVKCGKQEYADEYVFDVHPDIAKAKLYSGDGTTLMNRTGMPNGTNAAENFKASTGNRSHVINNVRTYALNSGMKIMTALDLLVRTSTYISSQYKTRVDANDDNSVKKTVLYKENNEPLKWFRIKRSVEILGDKFDCARNMYPLKITYSIMPYEVVSIETPTYSGTNYFVPHKEYNYWFTGKNTEVLNFVQEYNSLYYATFGTKSLKSDQDEINPNGNHSLRQMKAYKVNSSQPNEGGKEGYTAEQGANIASTLYSPADQANIELDIVGDPDWISQSELFYSNQALGPDWARRSLPDRSVNYDHIEVFFALTFNTVVDYDIETGLADVTKKNFLRAPGATQGGVAAQSFLYRANIITTQLSQGKFVQKLQGTMQTIPKEYITGKGKKKEEKREVVQSTTKIPGTGETKPPADTKSTDANKQTPEEKCQKQREELKKKCKTKVASKANATTTENTAGE